jgi:hypothetical protein
MKKYYSQKVTSVEALGGYRLKVTFADHFTASIELAPLLDSGPMFAPLRDLSFFNRVRVSPEWGVLEWPQEIDLSPGTLRAWCEAGSFLNHEQTENWIQQHSGETEKVA